MFKDKLKELLKVEGINQKILAERADIPRTTISGWLNFDRLPDFNALKKLSLYFNVSANYLLGLEDEWGNVVLNTGDINGSNNTINCHNVINSKFAPVPQTTEEEQLIVKYRQASDSIKEAVDKLLS